MPEYRFYTLKRDGHLAGPSRDVQFQDDEAAVKEAEQLFDGQAIEIWQGGRKVAHIDPAKK